MHIVRLSCIRYSYCCTRHKIVISDSDQCLPNLKAELAHLPASGDVRPPVYFRLHSTDSTLTPSKGRGSEPVSTSQYNAYRFYLNNNILKICNATDNRNPLSLEISLSQTQPFCCFFIFGLVPQSRVILFSRSENHGFKPVNILVVVVRVVLSNMVL